MSACISHFIIRITMTSNSMNITIYIRRFINLNLYLQQLYNISVSGPIDLYIPAVVCNCAVSIDVCDDRLFV